MTSIGYYPSNYSTDNDTIHIEESVSIIPPNTFESYSNLVTVIFDSSINLVTISENAFKYCENISNFIVTDNPTIFLPDSVTYIGNYAFLECGSNQNIYIPKNLTYLGDSAFMNNYNNINTIILPYSLTFLGIRCFANTGLTETMIIMNCNQINKISDYCFENNAFSNISFLCPSITIIGKYAFVDATNNNNENFNIPNGIQYIDDYAFYGNYFSSVQIPNSVTYIGNYVFDAGQSVNYYTKIVIPASVQYLGHLFLDINRLTHPQFGGVSLQSIFNLGTQVYVNPLLYPGIYVQNGPICFLRNSKILILNENKKEKYVPIQQLKQGDLVKTNTCGYIKIESIGHCSIQHNKNNINKKNKLYVCSTTKYPELFENLIITGCHSILVNDLSELQRMKTLEITDQIHVTENKYRLFACIDERTSVYPIDGEYEIWHFALENEDEYSNYGIFANGLLVETTSKRMMREFSGI